VICAWISTPAGSVLLITEEMTLQDNASSTAQLELLLVASVSFVRVTV